MERKADRQAGREGGKRACILPILLLLLLLLLLFPTPILCADVRAHNLVESAGGKEGMRRVLCGGGTEGMRRVLCGRGADMAEVAYQQILRVDLYLEPPHSREVRRACGDKGSQGRG